MATTSRGRIKIPSKPGTSTLLRTVTVFCYNLLLQTACALEGAVIVNRRGATQSYMAGGHDGRHRQNATTRGPLTEGFAAKPQLASSSIPSSWPDGWISLSSMALRGCRSGGCNPAAKSSTSACPRLPLRSIGVVTRPSAAWANWQTASTTGQSLRCDNRPSPLTIVMPHGPLRNSRLRHGGSRGYFQCWTAIPARYSGAGSTRSAAPGRLEPACGPLHHQRWLCGPHLTAAAVVQGFSGAALHLSNRRANLVHQRS